MYHIPQVRFRIINFTGLTATYSDQGWPSKKWHRWIGLFDFSFLDSLIEENLVDYYTEDHSRFPPVLRWAAKLLTSGRTKNACKVILATLITYVCYLCPRKWGFTFIGVINERHPQLPKYLDFEIKENLKNTLLPFQQIKVLDKFKDPTSLNQFVTVIREIF
jgi:hypothetical protein